MSKDYSHKLANMLISYMESEEYRYDFDKEAGVLQTGFGLEGKLGQVRLFVNVDEDFFTTVGAIPMHADEECRVNVAEFLTRANFGLTFGNFELDMDDGEIRYKYTVDCEDMIPSRAAIAKGIGVPVAMFERYGEGLLRVMFGMASPEEAIRMSEGN